MSFYISMSITAVPFLFVLYYLIFFLLLGSFINPRLTPLVCCKRLGPIYVQDHKSRMLSLDQSCYFALLGLNPSKQCENMILNQHSAQIHAVGSPGADFLREVWWKSMYGVLAETFIKIIWWKVPGSEEMKDCVISAIYWKDLYLIAVFSNPRRTW